MAATHGEELKRDAVRIVLTSGLTRHQAILPLKGARLHAEIHQRRAESQRNPIDAVHRRHFEPAGGARNDIKAPSRPVR